MMQLNYLFVCIQTASGVVFSVDGEDVLAENWLPHEFANQLGSEGWELAGVMSDKDYPTLIFKRPMQHDTQQVAAFETDAEARLAMDTRTN